jgi:hypothetical protein
MGTYKVALHGENMQIVTINKMFTSDLYESKF